MFRNPDRLPYYFRWIDRVKPPPALIVDLRGNGGGIDVGNEIVKRLVTSDLRVSTGKRFVRYRRTPENLAPFLDTRDPSFKNWDAAVNLAQP